MNPEEAADECLACVPRRMAFRAEEGTSATSVLAGSMWHIKPPGQRKAEAGLEKGPGWWGIQMYIYRKGGRTAGDLTREGLGVPVHLEGHLDLFG